MTKRYSIDHLPMNLLVVNLWGHMLALILLSIMTVRLRRKG